MKRLLLLPFLCLMPAAANAESVWLILRSDGFEKIEMRDLAQCQEMREAVQKKGAPHWETFCLRGK